jgi:hypothetical protein
MAHARGKPRTAALVLTTRERGPLVRRHYHVNVWKPALREAGVKPTRPNGMHAQRHYYGSVLLDDGVTVRALADYWATWTLGSPCACVRASDARSRGPRPCCDRRGARLGCGPDRAKTTEESSALSEDLQH